MVKYILVASLLKGVSINRRTIAAYRAVGNVIGAKKRKNAGIETYISRGNTLLALCKKYHIISEHNHLFEIGTGWLHWYSLYIRLYYNVCISMMDIWDNRQFEALKASFSKLSKRSAFRPVDDNIDIIVSAKSFEDLYEKLNLNYIIEEQGSLDNVPTNSLDFIFSFHVLEHVPANLATDLTNNIYRTLKPGGYSIHQIGIDDHLAHFDKKVSPMNYLRFSDSIWKMFFENEVQYFNRMLMSDWLKVFESSNLKLVEKIPEYVNIDNIKIHPKYREYSEQDLSCATLTIVHKKG